MPPLECFSEQPLGLTYRSSYSDLQQSHHQYMMDDERKDRATTVNGKGSAVTA